MLARIISILLIFNLCFSSFCFARDPAPIVKDTDSTQAAIDQFIKDYQELGSDHPEDRATLAQDLAKKIYEGQTVDQYNTRIPAILAQFEKELFSRDALTLLIQQISAVRQADLEKRHAQQPEVTTWSVSKDMLAGAVVVATLVTIWKGAKALDVERNTFGGVVTDLGEGVSGRIGAVKAAVGGFGSRLKNVLSQGIKAGESETAEVLAITGPGADAAAVAKSTAWGETKYPLMVIEGEGVRDVEVIASTQN